jgi:hypothetical protein
VSIDVEPVLLMRGRELAHPFTLRVDQASGAGERVVELEKNIVDRPLGSVEQHLDQAKARIDRVEQGLITGVVRPRRGFSAVALGDVDHHRKARRRGIARAVQPGDADIRPSDRTVFAHIPIFTREGLTLRHQRSHLLLMVRQVVPEGNVIETEFEKFGLCVASYVAKPLIDADETAREVGLNDPHRILFAEGAKTLCI